ncbi:hypothetical protein [Hymenobacter actinosclerus]|uniref:LTXXQ motif family protein n=1 Tax=Hymenobacter actinosclerus TaxID=82805 RepID=A0A1I0GGF0_9BACT|nr:hypothetical protein [Hymenobacter actinosclerus]SET70206.1 hypothetical protein SAMN04487998_2407 [Hymenobacter actinosclerus]
MKKLLILLAAAALTAGAATAQTTNPTPRSAGGRMEQATPEQQADRLTKQLSLSADQRTQLVTLEQARRAEMQTMRGQMPAGGDRTAMRQTMQTMRDKYDTQLKGILTADQYTRYSQQREERAENRGGRKMKMKTKS